MKLLNTLIRSLLVASLSRLIIGYWNDDMSSTGPLVVSAACGLIYFFWYIRRPKDYHPTSFPGKLLEGVIRIARFAVAAILVLRISQADDPMTSSVLLAIGFLGILFYLPWFIIFRETDSEKEERLARKQNEELARRNNPGFFARIGQSLANASRPPAKSRTCPTCGGLGANRHWNSNSQSSYTSECSLCAGKGYLYT